MKARMKIDLSEKIRKGDAPPKGQEARYVRAGLAEEVTTKSAAAPKARTGQKKKAPAKPKASPAPAPAPAPAPTEG